MNIGFIADFFSDQILGGAELNDSVLISNLSERGLQVDKLISSEVSVDDILKYDFFIVSNFVNLKENIKTVLMLKNI